MCPGAALFFRDAPAGGVFYDACTMTPADIHAHFDLQRQASREHVDVPLLVRRERLLRLRKMLDEHGPVLAAAAMHGGGFEALAIASSAILVLGIVALAANLRLDAASQQNHAEPADEALTQF